MHIYNLHRGLSKRLHRYFSYQSTKIQYRSKIRKLLKDRAIPDLTNDQKRQIGQYYKSFGFNHVCTDWHRYYTHFSGNFHVEYIPEDFFYNVIEPSLNMRTMIPALTDKNLLDRIFSGIKYPKTIIKNINGFYFDHQNRLISLNIVLEKLKQEGGSIVIKPSIESGGGKNVSVLDLDQSTKGLMDLKGKVESYGENFVIQNFIEQHNSMKLLSETSVNTLRIKTLLLKEEVVLVYAVTRMGVKGARIDNTGQGGLYCRIDGQGKLMAKAFNGNDEIFYKNELGMTFNGFEIPSYEKAIASVKKLHLQVPYFKHISWDIAIDKLGEPVLIEYNVIGQGFKQLYGPLFGENTNQVLQMCRLKLFEW